MGSPDGQRQYKTQSDADGFYRLANVRPGRYVGGIEGPPFQRIYLVQSFTETNGGFGIILKAGEVRQFNVALKRAFTLTVRVRDEEGEPLSGIRVGLMSADGSHQVHASWTRMTDDRGVLRVLRIAPGRYRLCAEAEPLATTRDGGAISQEQLLRTCYPSAVDERQAALVAVGERAAPELEIVMRRGRTLTVSGTVFDSTGLPSAQARVGLNFYVNNGSGSRGMVVGPDGRFRLTNIVPGEYAVVATLGGTSQPELRREPEAAFVPLHLDTGDAEELVLRMAKTLTVKGTVVPEEIGTPLPPSLGSGLGIFARHAEDRLPGSGELNIAHADKDGGFELTRLFGAQLLDVVNLPRGWYVKSVRFTAGKTSPAGR